MLLTREEVRQTKRSLIQLSNRLRLQLSGELIEICRDKFAQAEIDNDQLTTLRLASSERVVALLRKVEKVLKRIDDNDYGLCIRCGRQIDKSALLSDVTETACAECRRDAKLTPGHD